MLSFFQVIRTHLSRDGDHPDSMVFLRPLRGRLAIYAGCYGHVQAERLKAINRSRAGTTPGVCYLHATPIVQPREVPYVPSFIECCSASPTVTVQSPKQSRTGKAN